MSHDYMLSARKTTGQHSENTARQLRHTFYAQHVEMGSEHGGADAPEERGHLCDLLGERVRKKREVDYGRDSTMPPKTDLVDFDQRVSAGGQVKHRLGCRRALGEEGESF